MSEIDKTYKKDLLHDTDFKATASGDFVQIEGIDNVKQRLMHRLMTQPTTLVHRPDFGVGLKQFQNGIPSLSTQRDIALRIKEQLAKDTDVESVDSVSIRQDGSIFYIVVKVTIVGYGSTIIEAEV